MIDPASGVEQHFSIRPTALLQCKVAEIHHHIVALL